MPREGIWDKQRRREHGWPGLETACSAGQWCLVDHVGRTSHCEEKWSCLWRQGVGRGAEPHRWASDKADCYYGFQIYMCLGGSYLCQMGTDAHGGQKRPSDPLELELLPNVGAENRIQLTWKSSKHFEPPF